MTIHTTKTFDEQWESDAWNTFSMIGDGIEFEILGRQNHRICLEFNKGELSSFFYPKETALKALIEKEVIKHIDLENVTMDDNETLELTQKGDNLFADLKDKANAIELFVKALDLERP